MIVEVLRASEALKPVIHNLALYYSHDFSEFLDLHCRSDGLFDTSYMDGYWPDRCFLIKVDGLVAGFAAVGNEATQSGSQFSVDEFFVLRKFRRRGVGLQASRQVFDLFRGQWEVHELLQNPVATAFFRKAIGQYTGGAYHELPQPVTHGKFTCRVQVFNNTSESFGSERE